jgi:hypothetical protein
MTRKAEILEWYCKDRCDFCPPTRTGCWCAGVNDLSKLLDGLIESIPCDRISEPRVTTSVMVEPHKHFVIGYNKHIDETEAWKQEAKKKGGV